MILIKKGILYKKNECIHSEEHNRKFCLLCHNRNYHSIFSVNATLDRQGVFGGRHGYRADAGDSKRGSGLEGV